MARMDTFLVPYQMRTIQVSDVPIAFTTIGGGDHPLLFLPDTPQHSYTSQIIDLNTEGLTIVVCNFPGCAGSPDKLLTFPNNYFYRDASLAHSLMKTLGYSTFSLFGFADGGTTALVLAATYPESIRKVIVLGARSSIHPVEIERYESTTDTSVKKAFEYLGTMKMVDIEQFQSMWKKLVDTLRRLYNQRNGDLCEQELPKIKCPTLILYASGDTFIILDQLLLLVRNIVNSRLHVFKSYGNAILSNMFPPRHHEVTEVTLKFLLEE